MNHRVNHSLLVGASIQTVCTTSTLSGAPQKLDNQFPQGFLQVDPRCLTDFLSHFGFIKYTKPPYSRGFVVEESVAFRDSCQVQYHLDVSKNSGKPPKMDGSWWKTSWTWMIWGYPYFFGNTHFLLDTLGEKNILVFVPFHKSLKDIQSLCTGLATEVLSECLKTVGCFHRFTTFFKPTKITRFNSRVFVSFLFKGDNAGWFQQSLHYSDLDLESFSHIPWLSVMYPCILPTLTLSARVWKGKHHLIHLCARHGWSSSWYVCVGTWIQRCQISDPSFFFGG